jgi:hypothetical protein
MAKPRSEKMEKITNLSGKKFEFDHFTKFFFTHFPTLSIKLVCFVINEKIDSAMKWPSLVAKRQHCIGRIGY